MISDGFCSAVVLVTLRVDQSRGATSMLMDTVLSCKNNASATLWWLHPGGRGSPSGLESQERSSDTDDFHGDETTVLWIFVSDEQVRLDPIVLLLLLPLH